MDAIMEALGLTVVGDDDLMVAGETALGDAMDTFLWSSNKKVLGVIWGTDRAGLIGGGRDFSEGLGLIGGGRDFSEGLGLPARIIGDWRPDTRSSSEEEEYSDCGDCPLLNLMPTLCHCGSSSIAASDFSVHFSCSSSHAKSSCGSRCSLASESNRCFFAALPCRDSSACCLPK